MPFNVILMESEESRLEEGGVSADTKRCKDNALIDFSKYVADSCGQSLDNLVKGGDNEREKLSRCISRFFWFMRVEVILAPSLEEPNISKCLSVSVSLAD